MAEVKPSIALLRERAKEMRVNAASISTEIDSLRNSIAAKERQRDEMTKRASQYESSALTLEAQEQKP